MSAKIISSKDVSFNRPIVVVCPNFRQDSGGVVVLHTLVHQLRENGVDAYAVQSKKDYAHIKSPIIRILKRWNHYRLRGRSFRTHPTLDVPIASQEIVEKSIIVYSETVSGNPFKSPRVVRWLLHKPSFWGVDMKMGPNEEIFSFHPAYAEEIDNFPEDRALTVGMFNEGFYENLGLPRKGTCRMVRKGSVYGNYVKTKSKSEIVLDGKSHKEIAQIFNTTEIFYCHDPYTAYLYFAVRCGCIPVVVPQPGLSSKDWRSGIDLKYGVAYGIEEIEWARSTSDKLLEDMKNLEEMHRATVVKFIDIVRKRFG